MLVLVSTYSKVKRIGILILLLSTIVSPLVFYQPLQKGEESFNEMKLETPNSDTQKLAEKIARNQHSLQQKKANSS